MRNLRDNKGFTLIELMIVVVIIGILAAIAIPKFTQVSKTAQEAEADPVMKQMCSLAEAEMLRTNSWALPNGQTLPTGFITPTAATPKYVYTYAGTATTGTATATAQTGYGLRTKSMDCESKVITPGAVVN